MTISGNKRKWYAVKATQAVKEKLWKIPEGWKKSIRSSIITMSNVESENLFVIISVGDILVNNEKAGAFSQILQIW